MSNTNSDSLSLDDSAMMDQETITLISFEGTRFDLTRKQALISKLIETALSNDPKTQEIPVLNKYKDVELSKVVEFLKHLKQKEWHRRPPMKSY